jgi:ribosome maturation factor RimP
METAIPPDVTTSLETVATAQHVRIYHAEVRGPALRVEIEGEGSTTLDACAAFSRALSVELRARGGPYSGLALEVGSPGIERRLYRPDQYRSVVGRPVRVRTAEGVLDGMLTAADDSAVSISVAGAGGQQLVRRLAYADVMWARVRVPDSELFANSNRKAG